MAAEDWLLRMWVRVRLRVRVGVRVRVRVGVGLTLRHAAASCHAGKDTRLLPKQGDDHIEPFITHWVDQARALLGLGLVARVSG